MFNKSMLAMVMFSATLAHAQPEIDMFGSGDAKPATPEVVAVPGVAPGGGPWQKGTYGVSFPITLLSMGFAVIWLAWTGWVPWWPGSAAP